MPVQLTTIPLSSTAVNSTGTISLAAMRVSALPRSPSGPFAHLQLLNESASGLQIDFPNTGDTWPIPAGRHLSIPIPPGESVANWTVTYAYPTAYTGQSFVYYLEFNEQVLDVGIPNAGQTGNQSRNVSVPIATGPATTTLNNPASPSDTTLFQWTPSAAQLAAKVVNCYVYDFQVLPHVPAAGSTVTFTFQLQVLLKLVGVTVLTQTYFNGTCWAGTGVAATGQIFAIPWEWHPTCPTGLNISTNLAFDTAFFNFHVTGKGGAPVLDLNYAVVPDLQNVAALGPIGFFTANAGAF